MTKMLDKLRPTLIGLTLALVLALTPFRPLKISGQSMEPTLRDGETYLLDHLYWKAGGPRRNDIVVVRRGTEKWVKRLVGIPGDRLQIAYRDDALIAEVLNLTVNPQLRRTAGQLEERVVAADEIFVIGDNLNASADSTNQSVGAFKLHDIIGIVRSFAFQRDFPFRQHL